MIGAGPSLERNGHLLRLCDDRFLLLATDAAVRYLWREEIYPDIVMTGEEQCRAAIIFKTVDKWPKHVVLVASTTANPFSLSVALGTGVQELYFYNNAHPALADRYRVGLLSRQIPSLVPMAGSITFHCYALAQWLGIKNVALVGCDMHVDNTGRTHAGGYSVNGIPPELINQSFQWHMRELERNCMANSGIVNCTGGGQLEVFPKVHLQEFIAKYKPHKPDPSANVALHADPVPVIYHDPLKS